MLNMWGYIYSYNICNVSVDLLFLKLRLLLPSLPALSCPESSSPPELPPMCSRSRHAACMPMGGSSQLRLLQVAEHLTHSKECRLDIITGSNQNALEIRSISRRAVHVESVSATYWPISPPHFLKVSGRLGKVLVPQECYA